MASQFGLELAACIIIGVLGGKKLDEVFETNGVFVILGTFLGIAAGFWSIFRSISAMEEKGNDTERKK